MKTVGSSRGLLFIYAVTVFVSAFLLFQVQPLISRRILPWFGGSPAVWTTCMLFFQCVLFLGYAYAHAAHKLAPKWQAVAHLVLLMAALALARIDPSPSWKPQDAGTPMWRILMLLTVSVGLPYFVLATTGPLLQAWFSRVFAGRSPYRLYALSNVGSLIALLSYPFWFEPQFGLSQQSWLWFGGFALFAGLCGFVAFRLWRHDAGAAGAELAVAGVPGTSGAPPQNSSEPVTEIAIPVPALSTALEDTKPKWFHWILWLALPAFGSFMLLATTNHVCQDVAVVPFLWVVPLSVYLLTFIIAFDHPRWYQPVVAGLLTIVALYAVTAVYYLGIGNFNLLDMGYFGPYLDQVWTDFDWLSGRSDGTAGPGRELSVSFVAALAFYFVALFMVCLLCHGQLARLRPAPRHLTAFYLMIAGGGAIGGLLVSLVAPLVFTTYLEWKLGVVGGYLIAMLVVICVWISRTYHALRTAEAANGATAKRSSDVMIIISIVLRTVVVGLLLAGLYETVTFLGLGGTTPLEAVRNFYGTVSIRQRQPKNPDLHRYIMYNGRIVHGVQFADPKKRSVPTTYYTHRSGIGRTLDALQAQKPDLRVGAVGLGVGTLAAYAGPQSRYTFYEINPVVERFARDTRYFTYLADHKDQVNVVLGDARLSLEREPSQRFHLLVLDAFSGDAIPTHLLTREAFEIYRGHMANKATDGIDGSIAVHVTNKFFNLRPVVKAGAAQLGLECLLIEVPGDDDDASQRAHWMILTRNPGLIQALRPHVTKEEKPRDPIVWTDDHSDPYKLLIR
ncbi:MAG: fused MFS/spermidine synthase [Planctomycetes bacterium]|nr:fused MFS/spermidine synthase [Planctomycetota bacterium]